MTDHLFQGGEQQSPRTARQKMNALASELSASAQQAAETGCFDLADALVVARGHVVAAAQVLQDYRESL